MILPLYARAHIWLNMGSGLGVNPHQALDSHTCNYLIIIDHILYVDVCHIFSKLLFNFKFKMLYVINWLVDQLELNTPY